MGRGASEERGLGGYWGRDTSEVREVRGILWEGGIGGEGFRQGIGGGEALGEGGIRGRGG